ncbi:MAG: hypothetical protein DBY32_11280 [Phascolarctobacterium sp.]|nr:MAG: hypothetical protein DBY32_11280 [Phascolarctobacterium sp.]
MATIEVEVNEQQTEQQEEETVVQSEQQQQSEPTGTETPEEDATTTSENEEAQAEQTSEETEVTKGIQEQQQAIEDAKGVLNEKGLDYDALTKEYEEHGTLSNQTYADLAKAGFSKTMVDTFIAGIEASNDRFVNTVYGYAGGEQEYQKVAQYISSKGKADVDSFNALLETGNLSAIKMVIAGAKAEMTLRNGTTQPSVLGGASGAQVGGFANEIEMTKAMSDARYGTDDNYTKTVQEKLAKSAFIQFNK